MPTNPMIKEEFDSLDSAMITAYCTPPDQELESTILDFKKFGSEGNCQEFNTDKDKMNIAKTLSGFANTEGGIVIWGVSTKKRGTVDYASSFQKCNDPDRALSQLKRLSHDAVSPMVPGLTHEIIRLQDKTGILKTYVPKMEDVPRMAMHGFNRYYGRVDDSFRPLNHDQVAALFRRSVAPDLRLGCAAYHGGIRGTGGAQRNFVHLRIYLCNTGIGGLALYPFISVKIPSESDLSFESSKPDKWFDNVYQGRFVQYLGRQGTAIPPGATLWVGQIKLASKEHFHKSIELHVNICAEHATAKRFDLSIEPDNIHSLDREQQADFDADLKMYPEDSIV